MLDICSSPAQGDCVCGEKKAEKGKYCYEDRQLAPYFPEALLVRILVAPVKFEVGSMQRQDKTVHDAAKQDPTKSAPFPARSGA